MAPSTKKRVDIVSNIVYSGCTMDGWFNCVVTAEGREITMKTVYHIISILVLPVLFCTSLYAQVGTVKYSGGTGETGTPWQISVPDDLINLGLNTGDYSGSFIVTADIDLTGATYDQTRAIIAWDTDSSNEDFDGTPFTGIFDGNNKSISNLVLNDPAGDYMALFGYMDSESEIRNTVLVNVGIVGCEGSAGLVCEMDSGSIVNCSSSGSVAGPYYTGGLVAYNYLGSIIDCSSSCSVSGTDSVGGLCGVNDGGLVRNGSASGVITVESAGGGLLGSNHGTVVDSFAVGNVNASGYNNGGLIGYNGAGVVDNCHAGGVVDGEDYSGGLIGGVDGGVISNSHATGFVFGVWATGGFAGFSAGSIVECYASGEVTGRYYATGGLVGVNAGAVTETYATGHIRGADVTGGLVGRNDPPGAVRNSYATGIVDGLYWGTGGLVGNNYDGASISACYATGNVSTTAEIPIDDYSGGLVGINKSSSIENCYSTGSVSAFEYSGGLVGYNHEAGGMITNCYSVGFVTGGSLRTGGIAGYHADGTMTDCVWNLNTSGQANGIGEYIGGTVINLHGETTTDMKKQSTFTNWHFVGYGRSEPEDIWRMAVDDVDYPKLYWQYTPGDITCPDGVGLEDLILLTGKWLSKTGDAEFNYKCDLNDDEIVNIEDFAIVAGHWLDGGV